MAIKSRRPRPGLIFHTNRGIEYVSTKYQTTLSEARLRPSMSGKGGCQDDAHVQSFFHTLKTEEFYLRKYMTCKKVRRDNNSFIDFYNRERLHSWLDYLSPMEYEKQVV